MNQYSYDPHGNILGQQEQIPQSFKYVGQFGVMAEPNGFYYMRARYYDPKVGRFVSEDPSGFEGGDVNLYAYVKNNPMMGIDPTGLCKQGTGSNWLGTGSGESSAQWYANKYNETGNPLYYVGGFLSSLWTPETYQYTATTLLMGVSAAGWAAKTGPGLIVEGVKGTRLFQIRDYGSGRPIFRLDKGYVPGKGNDVLHYHRSPSLELHRPYQGGW